jgi:co-chaperonin GroES (HSP10)
MTETMPAPTSTAEFIKATWDEVGHRVVAIGTRVFLRTDVLPDRTASGIYLPPDHAFAYGQRLGSQVLVTGTVLSVGPLAKTPLKEGDRILFFRLPFGWTYKLKDKSLVGWIAADEIIGIADAETIAPFVEQAGD